MKRTAFALLLAITTLFPCFAQKMGVDIVDAVSDAALEISNNVPSTGLIAVSRFSSDSKKLSDWLEDEMFRSLTKKNLKLCERNSKNLNIINQEIEFQYSGAVSDETIAKFGKISGANYLVYGCFEQYGGMKIFEFRLTNIETYEVLIAKSYEIAISKELSEKLGDEMRLETIDDYIAVINSLDAKRNSIEKEMNADRDRSENVIRTKYQNKINEKTKEITELYDGMYSGSKLNAEITNAIKPIESERDALLKPVAANSRAKFADQLSSIENSRKSIVNNLQNTIFILDSNSVTSELLLKNDVVTETAYFSITLRSTDKYVNYSLSDRIDPKTPADFKKIRNMTEKTKSVCGEIEYKLNKKTSSDSIFDIVIQNVRVYNKDNGDTIYKKNAKDLDNNINGGTINISAQKSGAAIKKTTSINSTQKTITKETVKEKPAPVKKEKDDSNVPAWRKNEDKKFYFDISIDGVVWYWFDSDYYLYFDYKNPDNKSGILGDANFSIPIPFGICCSPKFLIEPARINSGIFRGIYGQLLGLGFEGKYVVFTFYPASLGFGNFWSDFNFSFLDMKLQVKVAKFLNIELCVRPVNFIAGIGYAPEGLVGVNIPIRFGKR